MAGTTESEIAALRAAVAEGGRVLATKGLVIGTGGNVSARLAGTDLLAVTPSGMPYAEIAPDDVVVLDLNTGRLVMGERRPSVETPVHRHVMRSRPDVGAAVHTHSTYASAVASSHREVPVYLDSMAALLGGPLRLVPYGASGSPEMQAGIAAALQEINAVLLANHGAFCVGRDLEAALLLAEFVEEWARIFTLAQSFGGPVALPDHEVRRERAWFLSSYGQRPAP